MTCAGRSCPCRPLGAWLEPGAVGEVVTAKLGPVGGGVVDIVRREEGDRQEVDPSELEKSEKYHL